MRRGKRAKRDQAAKAISCEAGSEVASPSTVQNVSTMMRRPSVGIACRGTFTNLSIN